MGSNSNDVKISTLSSVTGISSNDLFDHGPSGVSVVKMSSFFIDGVGRVVDDGTGPEARAEWEYIDDSTNTSLDPSPTPTGKDELDIGDQFVLGIYPINSVPSEYTIDDSDTGDAIYVIGQAMIGGPAWTITTDGIDILDSAAQRDGNNNIFRVDWLCEVSGYDAVTTNGRWKDGGYNSDMVHYDTQISFNGTSESSDPTVTISVPDADDCCPSTVSATITVDDPLNKVGTPEFYIDWGDGQTEVTQSTTPSHDYQGTGTYTVLCEMYDADDGGYDGGNGTLIDDDTDTTDITSGGAS